MFSSTAAQLVLHTSAALAPDARSTAGMSMVLVLGGIAVGVVVALRVLAVVTAVIQSVVEVALRVGLGALFVGFLASVVGLTYLGRSMGF